MLIKKIKNEKVKYSLNTGGTFAIEGYNYSKPFSNFFPGIAGVWGTPMWVFFVNRGQCISSFGIEGKDKSILEFQPANKAYRLTPSQGFRTFLKVRTGSKTLLWEPFQNNYANGSDSVQKMHISSHDLTIEDINSEIGLKVAVNYFTIPEEPYAALVRKLSITNLSRKKLDVEVIDGLPTIIPYGLKDWLVKNLARTVEAWVKVRNTDKKAPYYQLNVEIADTPQVKHIKEGNFYFSFVSEGKKSKLLSPIVEASNVFGHSNDFAVPENFLKQDRFRIPASQQTSNRTPSALSYGKITLSSKSEKEIISIIGTANSIGQLNQIVKQVTEKGFIEEKSELNRRIVDSIKGNALTVSSSKEFDLYSQQTFLDNVLRGGFPVSLATQSGNVAFNVFSRKHGDLERDYNYFTLSPTFYSQGNGNYRDVNQNRRNDAWFNKDVKDNNVVNFLNLVQVDGYNPLVVKGMTFSAEDSANIERVLDRCVKGNGRDRIRNMLKEGFQPGELISDILKNGVKLKVSHKVFLEKILGLCHKHELADHGEGYWADHWTYNLDLIESYLSIYPEELRALLFDGKKLNYYHDSHYVLPRGQRYILTKNGVRQYHSVHSDEKSLKISENGNKLRIQDGEGPVYMSTLLVKQLCLIANKAASLDPSGIGIEMEADKPNWYDALNGLPGLLGSSISETLELMRLSRFLLNSITALKLKDDDKVSVFSELLTFVTRLSHVLSTETNSHAYWMKSNDLKEHYRYRIRRGIDGQQDEINIIEIKRFLELVIAKTSKATSLAKTKNGLYSTYFYHEVVAYEVLEKQFEEGVPYVKPTKFKRHALPLFLEGYVHGLRVVKGAEEARKHYQKVHKSPLFDKKLKMYKVNADLSSETEEIGRTRIFPRGWLENESIWLHMEYKFILELLRCELYDEFYDNFKSVLVPFLKPEVYGRSTLENSSFIVSSAHEDEKLHGQGFVARLSGSTAEFIHIWLMMNVGKDPFFVNSKGELNLQLRPGLAKWLFTNKSETVKYINASGKKKEIKVPKDSYAFNFLGSILTVYHNPKRKNTFGRSRCRVKKIEINYPNKTKPAVITGSIIPSPYSRDIRERKVERIDVHFA